MAFEWDEDKDWLNRRKHGIPFKEAKTVFDDPLARTTLDPRPYDERRFATVGYTASQQLIVVWHTFRGDHVRIIGARTATRRERHDYESR